MGIFSNSTPFDEQLDKATDELNTETDWGLIISLCDKIKSTSNGPSTFAPAVMAKLNNKIPHVSMQALTVLDACIKNCGKDFQKVVASPTFTDGLREFMNRYKNPTVTRRLRYFIKKWSESLKDEKHFLRFVSFYYELRAEGLEFPDTEDDNPQKKTAQISRDPDVASSQQEADDLAKAIEASLQEEKHKKQTTVSFGATSSLYPSMTGGSSNYSSSAPSSSGHSGPKRKVKALYDFEAAEDNELTFKTGDIITILDDSDANWWKGEGANGSGLFPSNFVTSDLTKSSEEEEKVVEKETVVKFNETLEVKEVVQSEPVLQINENLIDETLAALQSTDPETTTTDSEELVRNEETCLQMGKLIDNQLEDLDRRHLELSVINEKILESLRMYDNLMKQAPIYSGPRYPPMGTLTQPAVMSGYSTNPSYSTSFLPNQVGPQVMPQQMGPPSTDPAQGYNPMYQGPPGTAYNNMVSGGVPTVNPQGGPVLPNQTFPSNQVPQQPNMMSYGTAPLPQQPNVNYQDGNAPPMMSQYQNQQGMAGTPAPSNYSSNQVSSQPLM